MHTELVVAFVFLSLVSSGSALDCYVCGSTESWSMCMKNRFVQTCKPWEDRCYKASVDTTIDGKKQTRFTRGCTSAKLCFDKSMPDCRDGLKKEKTLPCDVFCCAGRICNTGALPVVSGIIIMTCALLGLLLV